MANLHGKKMFGREGGLVKQKGGVCYLRLLFFAVWVLLSWNPLDSDSFAIPPRNYRFFGPHYIISK